MRFTQSAIRIKIFGKNLTQKSQIIHNCYHCYAVDALMPVGGVAQWLERRCLTGELRLIYG